MCISNGISDDKKKEYIHFLISQIEQKTKQVEDSTKLYFQSLFILGASIAIVLTTLAKEEKWADALSKLFVFGVPFFLIAWFGCFLFIYWEHHMLRISLDFSEKKVAEALGIPQEEYYLYHEDFLGVFNQANFLSKKLKAVQVVFIFIGILVGFVYFYFVYEANKYLKNPYVFAAYFFIMFIIAIILLIIHYNCVRRERRLKEKLNIATKVETL